MPAWENSSNSAARGTEPIGTCLLADAQEWQRFCTGEHNPGASIELTLVALRMPPAIGNDSEATA
jgi:hypothetical protein